MGVRDRRLSGLLAVLSILSIATNTKQNYLERTTLACIRNLVIRPLNRLISLTKAYFKIFRKHQLLQPIIIIPLARLYCRTKKHVESNLSDR